MKILKAAFFFSDVPVEERQTYVGEAIEYEGSLWLVTGWLPDIERKWQKPTRIVCIDTVRHQRVGDLVAVNAGIPKALFDGQIPPKSGDKFVVKDDPDIKFPYRGPVQ
jgi:hypothetical protein